MDKLLDYFNGDELAANVWLDKYAKPGEETPDDMHKRMAKEFSRIEEKYYDAGEQWLDKGNLSDYGSIRPHLQEEDIYNFFKDFKYIIPQGSIMDILGSGKLGSLSNCFVIGQPHDSYGGIFLKDEEMAQLEKRRGGIGLDISTLRPSGTPTTNAAKTSTGAVSFMHRFSNTTREVAQNGRRGALMLSIDINHPDVMDFIKIKRDLTQITGANISIKLNKEFMEAVEKDEDYVLRFPCDAFLDSKTILNSVVIGDRIEKGLLLKFVEPNFQSTFKKAEYIKIINAREYWNEIIKSAHNVAEPGLMFWDNMINYSPDGVYPQYKAITTNPCSEIGMQEYDACRLIAVNLFSFVENPFTENAKFDLDKFYKVNYEAMRLSDNLIDLEAEHIDRIIEKIKSDPEPFEIKERELELWYKIKKTALASRRTGLGFTALADTLAALGLKYDSEEALDMTEKIMDAKMSSELDCTTDLAILRGTFEGWESEREFTVGNDRMLGRNLFYEFITKYFPSYVNRLMQYGRRNASWSTVAPTGTVSLMARTSSGIEPVFMMYYMRRKKINPGQEGVRVDFTDQNGDTWQEFPVLHPKFKEWCEQQTINVARSADPKDQEDIKPDLTNKRHVELLYASSPWFGSTANDIDWSIRVKLQGVVQKYTTHSISSTINLPNDVSEEEVSKIYMESWKAGLKGITVYRDGSRSGVLVSESSKEEGFHQTTAPKRPERLKAEAFKTKVKGKDYSVVVGLLNEKPYEVFITEENLKGEGLILKQNKNYSFVQSPNSDVSLTNNITDEQAAITRLISTSLRHGAEIKFIVEQLQKTEGDLFSFTKGVARILKKFIPEGTKSTVKCHSCGSDNMIFEEGCNKCLDCGQSACS